MRNGSIFLKSEPRAGRSLRATPPSGPRPRPSRAAPHPGASPDTPPTMVVAVTPLPSPPRQRWLCPGRSAWLGKARPGVSAETRLLPNPPTLVPRVRPRVGDMVGLPMICRLKWILPVTRGRWARWVKAAPVSEHRRPEVYAGAPGVWKRCPSLCSSVDLTAQPISLL